MPGRLRMRLFQPWTWDSWAFILHNLDEDWRDLCQPKRGDTGFWLMVSKGFSLPCEEGLMGRPVHCSGSRYKGFSHHGRLSSRGSRRKPAAIHPLAPPLPLHANNGWPSARSCLLRAPHIAFQNNATSCGPSPQSSNLWKTIQIQ